MSVYICILITSMFVWQNLKISWVCGERTDWTVLYVSICVCVCEYVSAHSSAEGSTTTNFYTHPQTHPHCQPYTNTRIHTHTYIYIYIYLPVTFMCRCMVWQNAKSSFVLWRKNQQLTSIYTHKRTHIYTHANEYAYTCTYSIEAWSCDFAGGEEYLGLWRKDQPHTSGAFCWFNGDTYLGDFAEGGVFQVRASCVCVWVCACVRVCICVCVCVCVCVCSAATLI